MKKKQQNVLAMIAIAVIAYLAGAMLQFPFVESNQTLGSIGKAKKQREVLSPSEVKLLERFENDTTARQEMVACMGNMLLQNVVLTGVIDTLIIESGEIDGLKENVASLNNLKELTEKLTSHLTLSLKGLEDIANNEQPTELGLNISQCFNLFQIVNAQLVNLEDFTGKVEKLQETQAKLSDAFKTSYDNLLMAGITQSLMIRNSTDIKGWSNCVLFSDAKLAATRYAERLNLKLGFMSKENLGVSALISNMEICKSVNMMASSMLQGRTLNAAALPPVVIKNMPTINFIALN